MSRQLRALLSGLFAAAALLGPAASGGANYEPEPEFCKSTVIHDYLRPLGQLPQLHWPKSGRLSFAPGVRLTAPPQLVSSFGGARWNRVGFTLLADRVARARPEWTLTATLSLVNWRGRVLERVGRTRVEGGSLSPHSKLWSVGEEPAAYRLTLVFRSVSGKLIATFGRYFRVVFPREIARFSLNATTYRRGQTVFGRLENLGTVQLTYGGSYEIQRWTGDSWIHAPEDIPRSEIFVAYFVAPGISSDCAAFWIPPTMPPGRYQMLMPFEGRQVRAAEFEILP